MRLWWRARRSELELPRMERGHGQVFLWDSRDPLGRARAERDSWLWHRDSIRELRLPRFLNALSWDEIYAAIRAGQARISPEGFLIPVAQGGGAETIYCCVPVSSNAPAVIALTTARKTLIQVATPSTVTADVIQWGCSFDAAASAQSVMCDLTEVDVAATSLTSFTPVKYADANAPASLCVGGTSATGTNAGAEGTIAASRIFDSIQVQPTSGFVWQYPLAREPKTQVSKFLRVRGLGYTSDLPNSLPGIIWRE